MHTTVQLPLDSATVDWRTVPVELIAPGRPLPLVVAADAQTDRDAAADLCQYLSRVTGKSIQPSFDGIGDATSVIHVGWDEFAQKHVPEIRELFADGYIIKGISEGQRFHLVLAGRMGASTQWAVERFLTDYAGVHWLFPDPKYGEIVPSRSTISVDPDVSTRVEPDYISRTNVGMYMYNPARTQLRYGPVGYDYGQHALQFIFSEAEFKAHPEWFAFFNGKRNWWTYGNGWQICTTNPQTIEHALQYILKKFQENPKALMVSIGPNDGWGECECERCTAFLNSAKPPYTVSERWWAWVNKVAHEVKKRYPDKWVESLAYSQTSEPPRFKLEDNVAITKTIVLGDELELAEKWGRVCKSVNLYSYMYGRSFLGFRHYPTAARDFLKWGHDKLGARAHVTEGGGDWSFDGPKYLYLQAIQWDVDVDLDALMNEFCTLSYGEAAAKPMRAFWDRFEQVYERRRPKPYGEKNRRWLFYQWVGWATSSYLKPNDEFQEYTSDDAKFIDAQIDQAQRLLAQNGDEAMRYRFDRVREAWRFFRTALISHLEYYDVQPPTKIGTQAQFDAAANQVHRIAELRAERTQMLRAMRSYPVVNPRMADAAYWSQNAGLTIFSHESMLLDETCFAMSRYLVKSKGANAAKAYWQQLDASDPLQEAANTQIYVLKRPESQQRLTNGNFESGNLNSWESGDGNASVQQAMKGGSGQYAAQMIGSESAGLSQKVSVAPMERYRLSAMARYLEEPNPTSVPAETEIEFYAGERRIWEIEPTRAILRTASPSAGWLALRSTVTVPPGATTAVVRLKCTIPKPVLWDDIRFERIKDGVSIGSGELIDQFEGEALDRTKWFQSTASGGMRPPEVRDGWLCFEGNDAFPLTSFETFDRLLSYRGDKAYRLQFRAARAAGDAQTPSAVDWAVQAETSSIRTQTTGLYWTNSFADGADQRTPQLYCYASQGQQRTIASYYPLNHLLSSTAEVWYTIQFDPSNVAVYASTGGYDTSEASLVAQYEHGITNALSDGDLHLKINARSCRIRDLSLASNAVAPGVPRKRQEAPKETDPRDLTMPGVTDR